jgi:hypothetical protein
VVGIYSKKRRSQGDKGLFYILTLQWWGSVSRTGEVKEKEKFYDHLNPTVAGNLCQKQAKSRRKGDFKFILTLQYRRMETFRDRKKALA